MSKNLTEVLVRDLANVTEDEINDFKTFDKGCSFSIPCSLSDEMIEDDEYDFYKEIGCEISGPIKYEDINNPDIIKRFIDTSINLSNEFAESGEEIVFAGEYRFDHTNEPDDEGYVEGLMIRMKGLNIIDEDIDDNLSYFVDLIENNNSILWRHEQIKKPYSKIWGERSDNPGDYDYLPVPKLTALEFEKWFNVNNKGLGFDDLEIKFEEEDGEEYFVVRLNLNVQERILKKGGMN